MNIEEKDGIFSVYGVVDEKLNLANYNIPSGKVKFDLTNLKSINSSGLREWVRGLEKYSITPIYLNCPHFFTMLLNITRELLEDNATVESFQIPAHCSVCDDYKTFQMKLGRDFFPGKPFTYEFPKCDLDGGTFEPESDMESDYIFISTLK